MSPTSDIEKKSSSSMDASSSTAEKGVSVVKHHAHADDRDEALLALTGPAMVVDPKDAARVLRRIDWILMPLMLIITTQQFLDKNLINYANLLGFQADLNMKGQDYAWLGSVFYFAYLGGAPVHGYFLQHVPLSPYLAVNVFLWGGTVCCHAACKNFGEMVAARFFLGFFESSLTPSLILLTGRFYLNSEQPTRTTIWFSSYGWAQIIGGGVSHGILSQAEPTGPISRWQQLFLILGAIAMATGVVAFFIMPSSPATCRTLTIEDRAIAVERIRSNKTGINNKTFKTYQLVEALKDPRLYLFAMTVGAVNIANGGVSNFGSAIIKGFGFDAKGNALVGMSTGVSELVALGAALWVSRVTNTRAIPGIFCLIIAIIGAIMVVSLPASQKAAKMAGFCLIYWFPVATTFVYSWLASAVAGTTKKIVFNVGVQLLYGAGNVLGPQTYRAKDAPDYVPAKITLVVVFAVAAGCLALLHLLHLRENRKRDAAGENGDDEPENIAFLDLTDKEIRSFRYTY